MRPKEIKRFWIIVACLLTLEAVGICVAMNWHRFVSPYEVSEIYSRYAGHEGIEVSFVKGLRINDSVRVDVTLLEATDDSAWAALIQDFGMQPPPPEVTRLAGADIIEARSMPKGCYSCPHDPDPLKNDEVSFAWARHQISIFHVTSIDQVMAIRFYQYNEMLKLNPEQ